jgi:hypothetical protein
MEQNNNNKKTPLLPDFNRRYKLEPKSDEYFKDFFKQANRRPVTKSSSNNNNNNECNLCSDSGDSQLFNSHLFTLTKKHTSQTLNNHLRSNMSVSSAGSSESASFDNNRILAIIAKEKYDTFSNVNETDIEDVLNKNLIETRYLSTPFEDDLSNRSSSLNSFSQMTNYAYKRDVYLEQKMKSDVLANKQNLKKFKVNDYFFKNLKDFEAKFFKKNERLSLSDTPMTNQFQGVEKYGSSIELNNNNNNNKVSQLVNDSIQKNREVLLKVKKYKNSPVPGFVKLDPIQKLPIYKDERNLITPPLLSLFNNINNSMNSVKAREENKNKFARVRLQTSKYAY